MKCGAKTRAGTPCQQPAGWGTEHPGTGRCKLHGGASLRGHLHPRYKTGRYSDYRYMVHSEHARGIIGVNDAKVLLMRMAPAGDRAACRRPGPGPANPPAQGRPGPAATTARLHRVPGQGPRSDTPRCATGRDKGEAEMQSDRGETGCSLRAARDRERVSRPSHDGPTPTPPTLL